jgi:protein-L-isoaspartate O-methyltransferase
MSRRRNRGLDEVLNWMWGDEFPNIAERLSPVRSEEGYKFPFHGPEKSNVDLSFKMVALGIHKSEAEIEDQIDTFKVLSPKDRDFIAYNLSHELKIASLAAAVALKHEDASVYEIGPAFGFSSLHYARLVSEKGRDAKLVAVERKREYVEKAEKMRGRAVGFAGDIEFIHGDGVVYLNNHLKDGDLVFSSIAPPNVMNGILDLLERKSFNLIASYSEEIENKVMRFRGSSIESIVRSYDRNAIFFQDTLYNRKITWDFSKFVLLSRVS